MPKDKIYNGEELFKAYCSWGKGATNPRLIEYARVHYPNPDTGRVSQMGPSYAMWHWAFQNPEDSYKYWKDLKFDQDPSKPAPSFEEYLKELLRHAYSKGKPNANIAGRQDIERFAAKYGLEVNIRVSKRDVIQVTNKNHDLFQIFFTVDEIQGGMVKAHGLFPDRIYPEPGGRESVEYIFSIRDIGVIGKTIV